MSTNSIDMGELPFSDTVTPNQVYNILREGLPEFEVYGIFSGSGTGKSDVVEQAAKSLLWDDEDGDGLPWDFDTVFGVTKEPTDVSGVPYPKLASVDHDGKDVMVYLPSAQLYKIMNAQRPTVVFFDELPACDGAVQKAIGQIILSRQVDGNPISEHVRFVIAGNRLQDLCGAMMVFDHVKKRMCVLEMIPDMKSWIGWACVENGDGQPRIPVYVQAFFKSRPHYLFEDEPSAETNDKSCCPRGVYDFSKKLKGGRVFSDWGSRKPTLRDFGFQITLGDLGRKVALEMIPFLEVVANVPMPQTIALNPDTAPVPDKSDLCYMVTGSLAYTLRENPDLVEAYVTYVKRMSEEHQMMFASWASFEAPEIQHNHVFNAFQCTLDNV